MRPAGEILARIERIRAERRVLEFETEVLISCLTFEQARPYLQPVAAAKRWDDTAPAYADLRALAQDYLRFAFGKAIDHRGISANRSVDKIGAYLWLLELDEALVDFEAAPYAQYGAPKLRLAAAALNVAEPDDPDWQAMAQGLVCPSCQRSIADGYGSEGCGG